MVAHAVNIILAAPADALRQLLQHFTLKLSRLVGALDIAFAFRTPEEIGGDGRQIGCLRESYTWILVPHRGLLNTRDFLSDVDELDRESAAPRAANLCKMS